MIINCLLLGYIVFNLTNVIHQGVFTFTLSPPFQFSNIPDGKG